jgi:hypothetical protein
MAYVVPDFAFTASINTRGRVPEQYFTSSPVEVEITPIIESRAVTKEDGMLGAHSNDCRGAHRLCLRWLQFHGSESDIIMCMFARRMAMARRFWAAMRDWSSHCTISGQSHHMVAAGQQTHILMRLCAPALLLLDVHASWALTALT